MDGMEGRQPAIPSSEVEPGTAARTQRLNEIASDLGGMAVLSRRSGVPMPTLHRILTGQDMKTSVLIALAKAADVRIEWLAVGAAPKRVGEELAPDLASSGTVLIPRYDARAAAGGGDVALEPGKLIEELPFPIDFIRRVLGRNPAYLALLECAGDSMVPTLFDGDLLMVDTSVRELTSAQLYIVMIGNSLLAKRLQRRVDGSILVISDNPRYPPEAIVPSEHTPLQIFGEVIWRSGSLRN